MGAGQARGIVEEIFELVDPDASGTLTREEYSEMVGHLSKKKDLRNILPKMDHIDTDGDNMVSLKELREFFTKAKLTSKQLVLVKNAIVHSLDDTYANSLYNVRSKSPKGSKTNSAAKMQEVGSAAREIVAKGIIWHAQIFADDYHNPKHMNAHGEVRVRRPLPQIRSKDFFQELTYDDKKGSYVFGGGATGLNGWGGLKNLSLVSITYKDKRIMSGRRIVRAWDAYDSFTVIAISAINAGKAQQQTAVQACVPRKSSNPQTFVPISYKPSFHSRINPSYHNIHQPTHSMLSPCSYRPYFAHDYSCGYRHTILTLVDIATRYLLLSMSPMILIKISPHNTHHHIATQYSCLLMFTHKDVTNDTHVDIAKQYSSRYRHWILMSMSPTILKKISPHNTHHDIATRYS
ncbi:hypothetical protein AAMO2058_000140900 [Amorphochlora amoebiformis]